MLVGSIAGVENTGLDPARELVRGAGRAVAYHDCVDPHRLERPCRVLERLAFGDARLRIGGEVDDVGGQSLRGELERYAGPRGRFVEEVAHGATPQGGELLDRPGGHLTQRLGRVEDLGDVRGRELVHRQQVFDHRNSPMRTASSPSISVTCTFTISSDEVGRFLPTWSARMGSSRCPRSTSTASRIARGRPMSRTASNAARIVRPVYS